MTWPLLSQRPRHGRVEEAAGTDTAGMKKQPVADVVEKEVQDDADEKIVNLWNEESVTGGRVEDLFWSLKGRSKGYKDGERQHHHVKERVGMSRSPCLVCETTARATGYGKRVFESIISLTDGRIWWAGRTQKMHTPTYEVDLEKSEVGGATCWVSHGRQKARLWWNRDDETAEPWGDYNRRKEGTGSSGSGLIEEKRRAKLEAETKRRREARRETEGCKSYEDWWSDERGSRRVPKKKGQWAW